MAEQETNQGASGECSNDRVPVVRDGASKNNSNHSNVSKALIRISLDSYQLKVYILAVSTLNVPIQSIEHLKDFKAVFSELENAMSTKAVSMTIETLCPLGVDTSALQPHVKDKFVIQDHTDTDFVLTMGVILGNMFEDGYSNFLELVSRHFFDRVHRDGDRADFLKRLVQGDHIKMECLYLYSDFIRTAGCGRLLRLLTEFQIRQETRKDSKPLEETRKDSKPLEETREDCTPLEPPPRPMIPISSASSDEVSLDGARVRSNGIQEQNHLDHQQTNGSNENKAESWEPLPSEAEQGGGVQDIDIKADSYTLCKSSGETRTLESMYMSSPVLKHSPDGINFSNLVISQIPAKWRLFGNQLGFSKNDMDAIKQDCQEADHSKLCFISLFDKWERRGSHNIRDFTWRTVVIILSTAFLSEFELANEVYTFCLKKFHPSTDIEQHDDIMVPGEDGDKTLPPSTHRTADKSHSYAKVDDTILDSTDPQTIIQVTQATTSIQDWSYLSLLLGISHPDYQSIKQNYSEDSSAQHRAIITKWLDTGKASWAVLVTAFRNILIDKQGLANTIASEHPVRK